MSNTTVPIKEFRLELSDLTYTGHDLVRPESVLAQSDGNQQFIGGLGGEPNGLAMAADGSILVANLGTGTIQKLHPDGRAEEFLTEVDGVRLTSANFVFSDSKNRIWMAFSTREHHWWPAAAHPRRWHLFHQRNPPRRQRRVPLRGRDDEEPHYPLPRTARWQPDR